MSKKQDQPKKESQEQQKPIDFSKPIESPLVDYPGSVQFAHPFLPRHYRAWREAFYAREKAKGDENSAIVVSGNNELSAYLSDMWGDVLAVCEISLENFPPEALTDGTGESTPVTVGAWLVPIFQDHYFPRHLTMGG